MAKDVKYMLAKGEDQHGSASKVKAVETQINLRGRLSLKRRCFKCQYWGTQIENAIAEKMASIEALPKMGFMRPVCLKRARQLIKHQRP